MCNYEDNVLRDYQRSKGDDKKAADEEGAGMGRKASEGGIERTEELVRMRRRREEGKD